MRRIVILCLLLCLPVAWSWAAAGGLGSHVCGCAGAAAAPDDPADGDHDGVEAPCAGAPAGDSCGPDCADCAGQIMAGALALPALALPRAPTTSAGQPAQPFRNHVPDRLLRPPRAVSA